MRPERATIEHPIWWNVERGNLVEALANTFGKRRAAFVPKIASRSPLRIPICVSGLDANFAARRTWRVNREVARSHMPQGAAQEARTRLQCRTGEIYAQANECESDPPIHHNEKEEIARRSLAAATGSESRLSRLCAPSRGWRSASSRSEPGSRGAERGMGRTRKAAPRRCSGPTPRVLE